jgi:hypothetical protein
MTQLPQLEGWVPIRIAWNEKRPIVDWCHLGESRFTEPFFEETIAKCLQHPFNLAFRHQTPIETLVEWQAARPGLAPSGFIFHMSRCGSTLVAQMLAALPKNVVISEARPIDTILRAKFRGVGEEERVAWLRGLLSALGQPRHDERHFIVKFDSWHTLELPAIRRAFPGVPWIFLCRNPIEVMASQMSHRGAQTVPGMVHFALPGLDLIAAMQMPTEEYCARVLAHMCEAALGELRAGSGRVIDYAELPDAVCSSLVDYFGIDCTADDLNRMRNAARFDAKNPSFFFTADSAKKSATASEEVAEMTARWLQPIYAEMQALGRAETARALARRL